MYYESEPDEDLYFYSQEREPDPDTQDYLQGIVEVLYDDGNIDKLVHCLEELCNIHEVEFKTKELKIQKKSHPLMGWYIDMQQKVIGE